MNGKTAAVVFEKANEPAFREVELASPADDHVVVRMHYCGVSIGTESWWNSGTRKEDAVFPLVPGYQGTGEIVSVGSSVTDLKPGDMVAVNKGLFAEGVKSLCGTHCRTVVCPARDTYILDEGTDLLSAAFWVMAAVGAHGANAAAVGAGDRVFICGQGLIGQMTAQVCRLRGATVIASEISPERIAASREHSADLVLNPDEENVDARLKELWPDGADVAFESTGFTQLVDGVMDAVKPRGKVVLQGWYPGDIRFYFHRPHGKQITAHFPCHIGGPHVVKATLKLIARDLLKISPMVSHVLPAQEAPDGYRLLMSPKRNSVVAMALDWRDQKD